MRDPFELPEARKGWVKHHLARIGLSLEVPGPPLGGPKPRPARPPRDYLAELEIRDGFIVLPGGRKLSPTLAKMLHYRIDTGDDARGIGTDD